MVFAHARRAPRVRIAYPAYAFGVRAIRWELCARRLLLRAVKWLLADAGNHPRKRVPDKEETFGARASKESFPARA